MEEYLNFLTKRNSELISLASKMNDNDISTREAIRLRKQYVYVVNSFLEMIEIINKKLLYAKERSEGQIKMLGG
jgi:hypothetical protein